MSGAMNVLYRKKNYRIYGVSGGFIVHNTNYPFQNHHTHINNFHTCKYLIDLCIHESIPRQKVSDYLLISLIKLSNSEDYKSKIEYKLSINKNKRNRNRKNKSS